MESKTTNYLKVAAKKSLKELKPHAPLHVTLIRNYIRWLERKST